MRSYDNPNVVVRREQQAVAGTLLFFQKSKLKACHVFVTGTPPANGDLKFTLNGEVIGHAPLTEAFSGQVVSTGLLDVVIPQGSIVKVSGPSGVGVVAEYEVMPDADETTTAIDRAP